MGMEEVSSNCSWSWEEEKAFENALVKYTEDSNRRWENIAADVPGKTVEEIMHHYRLLEEDVMAIELGLVPIPSYPASNSEVVDQAAKSGHIDGQQSREVSKLDRERRKGIAWTEEEHRRFLLGLEKYGKGDWRSISRNFVVTRTPTQVASHAQKFFLRLNSGSKDRRRSSIHDITSVELGDAPLTTQMNVPPSVELGDAPMTAQMNVAPTDSGNSSQQPS